MLGTCPLLGVACLWYAFMLVLLLGIAPSSQKKGQQAFQPIRLPSGEPAPVVHQHADDTSVHTRTPRDAQIVLEASVGLQCAVTGGRLQSSKQQALGLGSLSHLAGPDPVTAVKASST